MRTNLSITEAVVKWSSWMKFSPDCKHRGDDKKRPRPGPSYPHPFPSGDGPERSECPQGSQGPEGAYVTQFQNFCRETDEWYLLRSKIKVQVQNSKVKIQSSHPLLYETASTKTTMIFISTEDEDFKYYEHLFRKRLSLSSRIRRYRSFAPNLPNSHWRSQEGEGVLFWLGPVVGFFLGGG